MGHPNRLTCEEVFARLDDFLDRELSPEEMRLVEEHIETCAACASEHRFERQVVDSVRAKLQRIELPGALRQSILARLASGDAQSP
jgi:mycothiol system anti-sigma-R factor